MTIGQAFMAFQPSYTAELNIPGVALENMMTCRVHRAVILGLITKPTFPENNSPVVFTAGNLNNKSVGYGRDEDRDDKSEGIL